MKIKISFVDEEANRKLDAILTFLKETVMPMFEDISTLLTAMDTKTNEMAATAQAIAAKLDALIGQISAGLTPAQAASIQAAAQTELAKLTALGDGLTELAADPANPVP